MKSVFCAILAASLLLSLLIFDLGITGAIADCFCKGCGCKGGPGWRGPDGNCVSHKALAKTCGTPPGAPCDFEAARQVCESAAKRPRLGLSPQPKHEK